MTNLEKWKKKLTEAKDAGEYLLIAWEMNEAHLDEVCKSKNCSNYGMVECKNCIEEWLNKEVEEDDVADNDEE